MLVSQHLAQGRPEWASITGAREEELKGFDDPIAVAELTLAMLKGSTSACPVCGVPLNLAVAESTDSLADGTVALFCSEGCRETWDKRPRSITEFQGSLRSPLMGA